MTHTWPQFCDWLARFEDAPWDQTRQDDRMAAVALNILAPYLPKTVSLPMLHYPYVEDADIDVEGTIEALHSMFEGMTDGTQNRS